MKALAAVLLLFVALPAYAASLPCTIIIDANGAASAMCTGTPAPVPKPDPVPAPVPIPTPPPGTCGPTPSNAVSQTMYLAGTNNYVFDDRNYRNPPPGQPPPTPAATSPQGTIQIFPLKTTWPDGTAIFNASVQFASYIVYNLLGGQYEVSFSKCPGDFETYKRDTPTQGTYPCGVLYGSDFTLSYIIGVQSGMTYCGIPAGEQWYMNWRSIGCPADKGRTCGQTFYVPRG